MAEPSDWLRAALGFGDTWVALSHSVSRWVELSFSVCGFVRNYINSLWQSVSSWEEVRVSRGVAK